MGIGRENGHPMPLSLLLRGPAGCRSEVNEEPVGRGDTSSGKQSAPAACQSRSVKWMLTA